ncbi:MAG TPA: biotin--[acetyl-CoA-carboxylase] ligase [Polyangiaceae bacterium]
MSSAAGFEVTRFDSERIRQGVTLGETTQWLASTKSTNDDALAAAKAGAPHGALFGAEAQTAGRGRRGNLWVSAPAEGLWFSILLRPRFGPELLPFVPLCAGLAVRAACARLTSEPLAVKWPNDLLAGRRKLAGILVESHLQGAAVASVVIGMGVNVAQRNFPEPVATLATSLALLGAKPLRRERLLASILAELQEQLAKLAAGSAEAITLELAAHDALIGRRIRVDDEQGVARGIDAAGCLRLELEAGKIRPCSSGHVELLD